MGAVRSTGTVRYPTMRAQMRAVTEPLLSYAPGQDHPLNDPAIDRPATRNRLRGLAVYPGDRTRAAARKPANFCATRGGLSLSLHEIYRTTQSDNVVQDRYSYPDLSAVRGVGEMAWQW